jgi:hypothetical protein
VSQALTAEEGIRSVVERMTADRRTAVDALDAEGFIDGTRAPDTIRRDAR